MQITNSSTPKEVESALAQFVQMPIRVTMDNAAEKARQYAGKGYSRKETMVGVLSMYSVIHSTWSGKDVCEFQIWFESGKNMENTFFHLGDRGGATVPFAIELASIGNSTRMTF